MSTSCITATSTDIRNRNKLCRNLRHTCTPLDEVKCVGIGAG